MKFGRSDAYPTFEDDAELNELLSKLTLEEVKEARRQSQKQFFIPKRLSDCCIETIAAACSTRSFDITLIPPALVRCLWDRLVKLFRKQRAALSEGAWQLLRCLIETGNVTTIALDALHYWEREHRGLFYQMLGQAEIYFPKLMKLTTDDWFGAYIVKLTKLQQFEEMHLEKLSHSSLVSNPGSTSFPKLRCFSCKRVCFGLDEPATLLPMLQLFAQCSNLQDLRIVVEEWDLKLKAIPLEVGDLCCFVEQLPQLRVLQFPTVCPNQMSETYPERLDTFLEMIGPVLQNRKERLLLLEMNLHPNPDRVDLPRGLGVKKLTISGDFESGGETDGPERLKKQLRSLRANEIEYVKFDCVPKSLVAELAERLATHVSEIEVNMWGYTGYEFDRVLAAAPSDSIKRFKAVHLTPPTIAELDQIPFHQMNYVELDGYCTFIEHLLLRSTTPELDLMIEDAQAFVQEAKSEVLKQNPNCFRNLESLTLVFRGRPYDLDEEVIFLLEKLLTLIVWRSPNFNNFVMRDTMDYFSTDEWEAGQLISMEERCDEDAPGIMRILKELDI